MNLLPSHEFVLIKPLVPDSVLPGDWVFGPWSLCQHSGAVIEGARINDNSMLEFVTCMAV